MGVESLSPGGAPKCKKETPSGPLTWTIAADARLPWLDSAKIAEVRGLVRAKALQTKQPASEFTVQYTVYCGLIALPQVVEVIRQHFRLEAIKEPEPRKPEPVATLALNLNAQGFVMGDPFVSSLPWAVNQILAARPNDHLDFTGFFGKGNLLERLLVQLERTLELLYLVKAAQPADEPETEEEADGELRPLSLAAVEALCLQVYAACGWNPSNALGTVRIQAKVLTVKQAEKEESTDLLNSFFVEDLGKLRQEITRGNYGAALDTFMSGRLRDDRIDIRDENDTSVDEIVMPGLMPLGCWPSDHGLVRAQQFAVNQIMRQLRSAPGIFSVNGPPGTGKTTLLRDIVAAVVVERAQAMRRFANPLDAFTEQLRVDGWNFGKTWAIDASLRKSGIVVASSNNGAVENITKELPAIKALPKGSSLRYLSALSDSMAAASKAKRRNHGATWGLIAAVMGSRPNRNAFFQKLRWSAKKKADENEEEAAFPLVSLWDLMNPEEYPPLAWGDAVERFEQAETKAADALKRMRSIAAEVQKKWAWAGVIPQYAARLEQLKAEMELAAERTGQAKQDADHAAAEHGNAQRMADALTKWQQAASRASQKREEFKTGGYQGLDDELENAEYRLGQSRDDRQIAERLLAAVKDRKPGLLSRVFSLGRKTEQWELDCQNAEGELRGATRALRAAEKALGDGKVKLKLRDRLSADIKLVEAELAAASEQCGRLGISQPSSSRVDEERMAALKERARATKAQYEQAKRAKAKTETEYRNNASRLEEARAGFEQAASALVATSVTAAMEEKWLGVGLSDDALQLESPWFDDELFQARQQLFCRAMELHESFIAHSWSKLKNNLGALMAVSKGDLSPHHVSGGVDRLWDSLFMVVPVVSTTFASFARMFDGWERESIGWLLIDEAGQTTPQAAAGAIWRSQRVVVVGDPRQLVPVVSLPRQLMVPLMDRCEADHVYHPILSSVQVLADLGNQFGTQLGKDDDAQWVGSPLRVHRRCLDPMFSVANAISYDNMMVYGAGEDKDDWWFGKSCWIDVPATTRNGNSVPEQIDVAVQMAMEFEKHYDIKAGGKYNLYLITPFRDVRSALEDALKSRLRNQKDVNGMFGTVHTFQGKESDVVILVLGGTPGSISSFAADKANLLNVALTRAKKRIYVIGSKADWADAPFYSTLYHSAKLEKRSTVPALIVPRPARGVAAF
ncbi:hypothetical protein GTP81_02570 [Rugamonas sp. FT107W]|uniref:DNA2/NAM7 helicase-like C-terminal domain-containing protein n=1 Tax=Duganella vulcania TaxID=2692166 RepID=A0A845H9W4_9BURK|nr:AAA domain-containing protein [Duganella vulcania]MYN15630.1 hypothetical protein [Duganella vulcania]